MNSKKRNLFIGLLISAALLSVSCKDSAFLRRMQDMELGVKNPTGIEELQAAIKKYQGQINSILIAEQRIGVWY